MTAESFLRDYFSEWPPYGGPDWRAQIDAIAQSAGEAYSPLYHPFPLEAPEVWQAKEWGEMFGSEPLYDVILRATGGR